jgi:AraC-like DNA-binding protein
MGDDLPKISRRWTIAANEFLILKPDRPHFPWKPCDELTQFYWLHFYVPHTWYEQRQNKMIEHKSSIRLTRDILINAQSEDERRHIKPFNIDIPEFGTLTKPTMVYERLIELISLEKNSTNFGRFRQQSLFQLIMIDLNNTQALTETSNVSKVAYDAANFIRGNFNRNISYQLLAIELNFHSTYITRCMKRIFGCTPSEYLRRYRVDQSKLLLLSTDLPIAVIANQVGYSQQSFYTYNFKKEVGETPLEFRRRLKTSEETLSNDRF